MDDQLLNSVKTNDFSAVKKALGKGADVNAYDTLAATALMWAVSHQNLEIVKFLVNQKASILNQGVIIPANEAEGLYVNLVGVAAANGDVEMLKYLHEELGLSVTEEEFNPFTDEPTGWTAIQRAWGRGHTDAFNYLSQNGADMLADLRKILDRLNQTETDKQEYYQTLMFVAETHIKFDSLQLSLGLYEEALNLAISTFGEQSQNVDVVLNNLGYVNSELNRFEGAEKYYLQSLEIKKKLQGENSTEYVTTLNNLGLFYKQFGDYIKAKKYYLDALEIVNSGLGGTYTGQAGLLNNLGSLYADLGDYSKAQEYLLKGILEDQKAGNIHNADYALSFNNLGSVYSDFGEYDKAMLSFSKAIEILDENIGEESLDYATVYNNMGDIFSKKSDYKKAEEYTLRSASIRRRILGESHPVYGTTINNLGHMYSNWGKYEEAERYTLQAMSIIKDAYGIKHPQYALALNNLGMMYSDMGDYSRAEQSCQEAANVLHEVYGEKHSEYALTLNNLGSISLATGDYQSAERYLLQASGIWEEMYGKHHPDYALALNNLAVFYSEIGNDEKALALHLECLQIQREIYGDKHTSVAFTLANLGSVCTDLSYLDTAEAFLKEAESIYRKVLGNNSLDVASTLDHLGTLYLISQKFDLAESNYLEALQIKLLSDWYPVELASSYLRLGNLYLFTNDTSKAEVFYLKCLEVLEPLLDDSHELINTVKTNLSILNRKTGNFNKAQSWFASRANSTVNALNNGFAFMSETEKENFVVKYEGLFNETNSFYYDANSQWLTNFKTWYQDELLRKGLVLNSSVKIRSLIGANADSTTARIFNRWMQLKTNEAELLARMDSTSRSIKNVLTSEAEKFEKQLTRLSQTFAKNIKIGKYECEDIQSDLGIGDVAIEFSSFRYVRPNSFNSDSTFYVALILRKDYEHPIMIKLCEEKQLDSLFQSNGVEDRDLIANLYRGAIAVGESNKVSYGKRLYELLWEPLDSLLNEGDKIYFAPSGLMHRIALAAIPYDDKGTLLSDRYQLTRLSTTAKLLDKEDEQAKPKEIALFGGIDYEWKETVKTDSGLEELSETFVSRALPADLDRGNTSWTYLPGTLTETESIATVATKAGIKVKKYSSTEATEERMKSLGGKNSPTVLHIATHGFFFPDPERDRNENRMLQMMGEREQVYRYSDDPLNRAGLLFAGANSTWKGQEIPTGREDGILTANEATYIPLNNTELVVLSACETGLGEIKGSEGVFGLQRAFKAAGAKYVMMSLWKVPDQETSEFMTEFYSSYLNGVSIPDSYHKAQKVMRNKYPHDPYKWAAFVLMR